MHGHVGRSSPCSRSLPIGGGAVPIAFLANRPNWTTQYGGGRRVSAARSLRSSRGVIQPAACFATVFRRPSPQNSFVSFFPSSPSGQGR
ncbi:hypothetical protein L596_005582 [Steinernema carpocapsae]|uniref:Uncharacterized protein n=1 Tax=Steinernema carpocapsae TaxID=34508 RepID=A0A4U8UZQ4_STECR|nr:hypothetical protein L596_005582 [Steinernema carpocapsae]